MITEIYLRMRVHEDEYFKDGGIQDLLLKSTCLFRIRHALDFIIIEFKFLTEI